MKKWYKTALITVTLVCSAAYLYKITSTEKSSITFTIQSQIPSSVKDVDAYAASTIEKFDKLTLELINLDPASYTFDNTILHWDQIGLILIERLAVIKSLSITGADQNVLQAADSAYNRVLSHVHQTLTSSPKIPITLVTYLERALSDANLSASQWHYLDQLASTIDPAWFPFVLRSKVQTMKEEITSRAKKQFSYLHSEAPEKTLKEHSSPFTLLNLNVCFLPGELPLLYGGVLPWPVRIKKVAERIISLDADIVCLQEVFERTSALELYETLKGRYSHFYIDIGPKNFGLSHNSAGLSSGLFVASKLPLHMPEFYSFTNKNENVNRGFFAFDIKKDQEPIAHVYTTHLEAFNDEISQQNREKQLLEMIEIMQRKQGASNDVAIQIICGDLNIPMGSNEPAEKTYNDYFIDSSSKTDKTLSYESRTYIDFTDFWWKAKQKIHLFSAKPEVLDYAALFTGKGTDKENMTHKAMLVTAIAPMNKLDNPKEALSDHHGLISYIRNNYKN